MATAEIYVKKVGGPEAGGDEHPVMSSDTALHEIKTLSGTSQATGAGVPADGVPYVWVVQARGGALRVAFGSVPTASDVAGGGYFIAADTERQFGARPGDKAAVITAA